MKNDNKGNTIIKLLIAVVIIAGIVAAVMYFRDKIHFGFGGSGNGGSGEGSVVTSVSDEDKQEAVDEPEEKEVYTVTVHENQVSTDDAVTISEKKDMKEYINQRLTNTASFILVDDQAIESTYTWVKEAFEELSVKNLKEEVKTES